MPVLGHRLPEGGRSQIAAERDRLLAVGDLVGVVSDVTGDCLPGQRRQEGDAEENRQAVVAQEALQGSPLSDGSTQ
ncbi:MAG: hypothetical protein M3R23_04230 [Actinomycetota bacterium]|nr:hypothetical protein [Actinomycetota bacterium]